MKKTIYMKDCKEEFVPTKHNSKLGSKSIFGVSYVPSDELIYLKTSGQYATDCKGTCTNCNECKKECYAVSSFIRFDHVTIKCISNTMQLRNNIEKHFQEIENYAISSNAKIIRYTESGEIENYNQFSHIVRLANNLPAIQIYLYTKNYDVLREYFAKGVELPDNLVILVSVWGDQGVKEYNEFKEHKNIKCFAVNSSIKCQAFCPAYKKNSKGKTIRNTSKNATCEKCGLCTNKHPKIKVIGCLEH